MPEYFEHVGQGRFSDMAGWIIKPGEPANIADAQWYAWGWDFHNPPEGQKPTIPSPERVQQILEWLEKMDAEGKFDRETRRVIVDADADVDEDAE